MGVTRISNRAPKSSRSRIRGGTGNDTIAGEWLTDHQREKFRSYYSSIAVGSSCANSFARKWNEIQRRRNITDWTRVTKSDWAVGQPCANDSTQVSCWWTSSTTEGDFRCWYRCSDFSLWWIMKSECLQCMNSLNSAKHRCVLTQIT